VGQRTLRLARSFAQTTYRVRGVSQALANNTVTVTYPALSALTAPHIVDSSIRSLDSERSVADHNVAAGSDRICFLASRSWVRHFIVSREYILLCGVKAVRLNRFTPFPSGSDDLSSRK
jgi:hypothetical protein